MSVTHSAQAPEPSGELMSPVAAIVYPTEVYPDAIFHALVKRCRSLGMSLAGVLQHQAFEGCNHRCDVILEDLASGQRIALFEDRGAGARGCRLDEAALAEAAARVEGSLERAPQILLLNKFGKVECKGGGLRDPIASAIDRGIAVMIGVPQRNLEAWRDFAGEFAIELPANTAEVERWVDRLR
jgi:Protein of unknown function (DUF2478)